MLCQSCGQNQATTHIKTIINGELAEVNLCRECAQKLGYNSFFGNFGMDFDKFLGSLMGGSESRTLKAENAAIAVAVPLMILQKVVRLVVQTAMTYSMMSFFHQSKEYTVRQFILASLQNLRAARLK